MRSEPFTAKLLGWHIYVSRLRLRLMPPATGRGRRIAFRLRELRNRRYNRRRGHCEICGETFGKEVMQMHHILPFREFPSLAQKHWNLLMLCPCCHFRIHKNPIEAVGHMQRVARKYNIDIDSGFRSSAMRRWSELHEQKGGAA